jgi:signal transduction histidine kinase
LSNAFKFTPENGKISIEIRPYGEQFSQQIKDESQIQEIIGKYGNDQFDSKASVKQKL